MGLTFGPMGSAAAAESYFRRQRAIPAHRFPTMYRFWRFRRAVYCLARLQSYYGLAA